MSSAASRPTASSPQSARWVLPLLIGYAVLALLGGVLHRPELGFAAIVLLLIAVGLPLLRRRSVPGMVAWLVFAILMTAAALSGHLQLAFSALPILILIAVAALFARTLRSGREPLIARCIRVIEGEQRLASGRDPALGTGLVSGSRLLGGVRDSLRAGVRIPALASAPSAASFLARIPDTSGAALAATGA